MDDLGKAFVSGVGKAFLLVGAALVVAGVAVLGFLGVAIYRIFETPSEVPLVKFVLEHVRTNERMIYGHAGNEPFELSMTDPAQTVVLLFLAVMTFWIVAGIAKSIIAAGLSMMRVMSGLAKEQSAAAQPGPSVGRVE